jgi:hypothetical protein
MMRSPRTLSTVPIWARRSRDFHLLLGLADHLALALTLERQLPNSLSNFD